MTNKICPLFYMAKCRVNAEGYGSSEKLQLNCLKNKCALFIENNCSFAILALKNLIDPKE